MDIKDFVFTPDEFKKKISPNLRLKLESGACTKTDNEKHLVKHFRFQIVVGLKVSFGCSIIRIQLQTNPGFP